ncbi:MAG: type I-B CRISPR-associated endonuclease Cas1b [Victivallaceae bacterium]|nr:type I-B CRISPR-associated endonuclease Cas1b [Victivallaceae bacterium]
MNLYLTRSGRLRRRDNTLSFETVAAEGGDPDIEREELDELPAETKNALPVESVSAIYVFGEVSINSKLMNFLAQKKIPVHFFNYYGHHAGTFLPHAEQLSGNLVIRQSAAYALPETRLMICRELLGATIHNIHSVVGYYARRKPELRETADKIAAYEPALDNAADTNELMGIEGTVRRIYYQAWPLWLGSPEQNFKRSYHPPESPLNALVSFVNSMVYTACVSELYRTALYPGISYLHEPQSRRYSLALDLSEPFKPVIGDRLVFRLWNNRSISDCDFERETNGYIMTADARRRVLSAWDALLKETVMVKKLGRSVSYRQLLRLDCYKLVNFLLEKREYRPYRLEY